MDVSEIQESSGSCLRGPMSMLSSGATPDNRDVVWWEFVPLGCPQTPACTDVADSDPTKIVAKTAREELQGCTESSIHFG